MLSTRTGLSPALVRLSRRFRFLHYSHWASPRSLATTSGVSVDFLSSGYLDVSVRRVRFRSLWIQLRIPLCGGFPHSDIFGSKIAPISPKLFAGCHVLHRLLVPRHPPDALLTLESPYAGAKPAHRNNISICTFNTSFLARPSGLPEDVWPDLLTARSTRPHDNPIHSVQQRDGISRPARKGCLNLFPVSTSMVEADGFEPTTYGLQSRRSPS